MELHRSSTGRHTLTSYCFRDLPNDPNSILRWSWENVYALSQFAKAGFVLWQAGRRELYIAAELCRTHPDLKHVVEALRFVHDIRLAPETTPEKEKTP